MAQTKKANRMAYDAKTYKQFGIRVRRDSALFTFLEEWKNAGNSINELVVSCLDSHYKDLVKRDIWQIDE